MALGATIAVVALLALVVKLASDTSSSAEPSEASTPPDTTPASAAPAELPPASVPATTSAPPAVTDPPPLSPPGEAFTEDFATPDGLDRFDFQLHTSSLGEDATVVAPTFMGEHDDSCQGPDTHRTVQGGVGSLTYLDVSDSDLIWWCAPTGDPASGHFMTALDTADIATLSFSPQQTFTDVTRVCWDQNMNNLGEGKWLNVFVVPESDVAAHGGNLNYLAATGDAFGGNDQRVPDGAFNFTWLRGSTMAFSGYDQTMDFWKSTEPGGMDPSPAPRYTICLQSGGDMVIERPDGTTDTMALGTSFPTGEVRVIFQDGSYNPTKHNGSENHLTWHWDNIVVEVS